MAADKTTAHIVLEELNNRFNFSKPHHGIAFGTIINARGSGIHETSKLFSMEIVPVKEVVLIISEKHLTDKLASSISTDLKMSEPGNGIIFIQDVCKTYGLY